MNALGACVTQWIIQLQSSSIISVLLEYYNKSIYWIGCKKIKYVRQPLLKYMKLLINMGKQFLKLFNYELAIFAFKDNRRVCQF